MHCDQFLTHKGNSTQFQFIGQCFFMYALNEPWLERVVHFKHRLHHLVGQLPVENNMIAMAKTILKVDSSFNTT